MKGTITTVTDYKREYGRRIAQNITIDDERESTTQWQWEQEEVACDADTRRWEVMTQG